MDELTKELSLLSGLMDAAALRTRVVAHNLANVNTPGFKRSVVVFEEALGEALRKRNWDGAQRIRPYGFALHTAERIEKAAQITLRW